MATKRRRSRSPPTTPQRAASLGGEGDDAERWGVEEGEGEDEKEEEEEEEEEEVVIKIP